MNTFLVIIFSFFGTGFILSGMLTSAESSIMQILKILQYLTGGTFIGIAAIISILSNLSKKSLDLLEENYNFNKAITTATIDIKHFLINNNNKAVKDSEDQAVN